MRHTVKLLVVGLGIFASACETIPYEDRVKAYEDSMTARFVGQSADVLVLTYGPPSSSYKLTDGREVLQFEFQTSSTVGGESYTSLENVTRSRVITDRDGTSRTVQETRTIPIVNTSPIRTINRDCKRRFVVGLDKKVERFNWEGNSCF